MQKEEFISAAIVTYNDCETTLKACRSILENTKRYPLRLYVIDNNSHDDTAQKVGALDGVTYLPQASNLGFGAAHNRIIGHPLGKYHFVINPDIVIHSDLLCDMADFMEQNPDIAMCVPKILNPDGTEQLLPRETPTAKYMFLGRLARLGGVFRKIKDEYTRADRKTDGVCDINFCTGCFFCIRSGFFERLGGFDERFFMYLEDADLTLRAKQYGRTVCAPQFEAVHEWRKQSSKSLKYLFIHIASSIKFLIKQRRRRA